MRLRNLLSLVAAGAALVAVDGTASASSHREAPFISKNPKVDASDFYMFRSYETARLGTGATDGYVTLIANYEPLQDPSGGPNFYPLDPDALYEIHIDNTGDGVEDLTFQFHFQNPLINNGAGIALPVPLTDAGTNASGTTQQTVAIPFINDSPAAATGGGAIGNYTNGVFTAGNSASQQAAESYTVSLVTGGARTGAVTNLTDTGNANSTTFWKPLDNFGSKSFGTEYATYAQTFVRNLGGIPGCTSTLPPRVFVGQRHESFAVNLGTIFDLINAPAGTITSGYANPGPADAAKGNIFNTKNVTSIALEIPASCLVAATGADAGASLPGVIGGWTTASVRQARVINPTGSYASPSVEGGAWAQVSRLGMPLVNEVVIGLADKDKFNSSAPSADAQFANYVTNPTLAEVIELLFGPAGAIAPKYFPRNDLVAAFLTGVPGVNFNGSGVEMQRLNTELPATTYAAQVTAQSGATGQSLGAAFCFDDTTAAGAPGKLKDLKTTLAGCDPAGFPNGRRPGDDVVDVELRVMMGYLFASATDAPARDVGFTDAVHQSADQFDQTFPYLQAPISGAPNANGVN